MKSQVAGILFVVILSVCSSFGMKTFKTRVVGGLPKLSTSGGDVFRQSALIGALTTIPTQSASAAEGSAVGAVSIPLLISILIMVPFLYYQQALKPKERTVKQIELDDNLRAKDGSARNFGRAGEARAGKRK